MRKLYIAYQKKIRLKMLSSLADKVLIGLVISKMDKEDLLLYGRVVLGCGGIQRNVKPGY